MKYDPININKIREQSQGRTQKQPFQHQIDAFKALNEIFTFKDNQPKSTLLVLPTGAGKTFTTVKWLYDQAISRNIKILWLAHSFHLLDQAHETFHENAQWAAEPRQTVNIRIVSSHKSHDNVSSIQLTDDIVIMTTQTAIGALDSKATSRTGAKMVSNLRKFIDSCRTNRLFIVLDEAHHAPAYGCRNLLLDIRNLIPNRYLIGLTATPTYTDVSKRGWLSKIFEHGKYNGKQGIAYETVQAKMIAEGILARPKFIEKSTGMEWEVDDKLYNRLVREHKELPEDIIGKLAAEHKRNDYIVDDYLKNREIYGKTIIFADRWFQCEYLKEKLVDRGVSADNVYSHIDEDPGSAEARNKRTSDDNKKIIEDFKHGKDGAGNDKLDVLINVRMLNEGMDVPTVKTVFITRQTTSSILITQMMGRALRGREAGGGINKSEANIVLFIDEWKQLINWATPNLSGGTEESKPEVRGFYPYESISIQLVQNLIKQINSGEVIGIKPYIEFLPDGWYQTEISFNASDKDVNDMQSFTEFAMVLEHTKSNFETFIDEISNNLSDEWSKEYLEDEWMMSEASKW
ncbi:MAG: DEAD/DEAH box helicase, partial [Candidatus Methanoperedens sp.]|nr:DEAD/DEAH box helicase [Candidatus Methanoperedens sp.]